MTGLFGRRAALRGLMQGGDDLRVARPEVVAVPGDV